MFYATRGGTVDFFSVAKSLLPHLFPQNALPKFSYGVLQTKSSEDTRPTTEVLAVLILVADFHLVLFKALQESATFQCKVGHVPPEPQGHGDFGHVDFG